MSWTQHFQRAKLHLQASRLDDALNEVKQALLVGGDREYTVYDCRAAIYERQGKLKNALQDARNVIKLAPTHWQGYARASRLFLKVRKLDEASTMADMALARLESNDLLRRQKLGELKEEVLTTRRQQVYHFGKLPVEIITAIFELVVTFHWSQILTIWRVSKHWHNIALNTPNLWSTLSLTNRHPVRHAQRWMERSKGRIRELHLQSSLPPSLVNLDRLKWGHLRICKLEGHDIAGYMGGKSNLHRLSELEELQVNESTLDCDPLLSALDSKLKRLTLEGPPFSWGILASNHHNLTSLEVRLPRISPSFEDVVAVLESNPKLEQLILEFETSAASPPLSSPSPLTLSKLRTLHLSRTPWAPRFFALVAMPSLQRLRLSLLRAVGLNPLIEKRPDLLHLSVNCCIVPSSELIKLLLATPNLKSLELIRLDETSNKVVKALTDVESLVAAPSDVTPLCPTLTHLDISHCPDIRTDTVMDLLRYRNPEAEILDPPVPTRIKTLLADGCPGIEANCIPWIRGQVKTFSCVYLTKRAATWRR